MTTLNISLRVFPKSLIAMVKASTEIWFSFVRAIKGSFKKITLSATTCTSYSVNSHSEYYIRNLLLKSVLLLSLVKYHLPRVQYTTFIYAFSQENAFFNISYIRITLFINLYVCLMYLLINFKLILHITLLGIVNWPFILF